MFKINPPLRSRADHLAFWKACKRHADMIATDHARTAEERRDRLKPPHSGSSSSETAFPLLYTKFVKSKMFTLQQLIAENEHDSGSQFELPVVTSQLVGPLI